MSNQVDVRSIEALLAFREELASFYDRCQKTVDSALTACRRIEDEIDAETRYWLSLRKRCEDDLAMARTELNRVRISTPPRQPPRDSDAKIALQRAKRRLEHCEQVLRELRNLRREAAAIADDLRRGLAPLSQLVCSGNQAALARLEDIIRRLEAYLKTSPPSNKVARASESANGATH